MSFAAARALIENRAYEHVDLKDNYIGAWDAPNRATPRNVFLNFCRGQLVQLQKHLQPRFDHFVRLVDEKRKELGRPLDAWSRPTDVTSDVERNSVSFIWRDGNDFVLASFTQFKANSQFDLVYETPNECWQLPYGKRS
jgi:hypothetical protein